MRRSVAVEIEREKIMAKIKSGKGFDVGRGFEAIVADSLLLVWRGFWQNIFFWLLQIFEGLCYSLVDGRSRTLKIKYDKGSKILQLKLTKIPIRD